MDTHLKQTAASTIAGLLTRKALAIDLQRSERTLVRYKKSGMPVIRVGMLRLYDPATVREWLLTHEHRREEPRRSRHARQRNYRSGLGALEIHRSDWRAVRPPKDRRRSRPPKPAL